MHVAYFVDNRRIFIAAQPMNYVRMISSVDELSFCIIYKFGDGCECNYISPAIYAIALGHTIMML